MSHLLMGKRNKRRWPREQLMTRKGKRKAKRKQSMNWILKLTGAG